MYGGSTYVSRCLGVLFGNAGFVFCVACLLGKIQEFLTRSLQVVLERRNFGGGLIELGVEFVEPALEGLMVLWSRANFTYTAVGE